MVENIATRVQERLTELHDPANPVRCCASWLMKALTVITQAPKKKSQVLIVGRDFDVITPLLHELTYQAAAYDLLQIFNDQYTFSFENGQSCHSVRVSVLIRTAMGKMVEKTATLNEQDELWVSYRHKHIASVMV